MNLFNRRSGFIWLLPMAFQRNGSDCYCPNSSRHWNHSGLKYEPFERNGQVDLAQPGWAYQVAQRDLQDVKDADALFAVVNGTPPDEGVMVELGVAIALGKPTFLFRDDFRRCTDSEDYPLNLMLFSGLPAQGWQDFVYTSLEQIADPGKAIARWARD